MKLFTTLIIFFIGGFCFAQEEGRDLSWPKEIESEKFTTTLYQPQLESFKNNVIEGRMALSIQPIEGDIVFGAIWFKSVLATDKVERTAVLEKMDIEKVYFPDIEDQEKIDAFTDVLVKEIESWEVVMSLDRIIASLKEVEDLQQISDKLDNSPPLIFYRKTPTTLITIDGDPKIKEDKDNGVQYVLNTPFFIVAELKDDKYYLKGGKFWYSSEDILQGWVETKKVPKKVEQFANNMSQDDGELDSVSKSLTVAPEILISTKPAEIVVTDGEPDYAAIEGTSLLYVKNSESDIIMDINSQEHYLLIAGRWYHAKKLDENTWTFEEPKNLPEEFSKIPENSDIGNVRVSVPGTPEAQDALLEQSIPQTATVTKSELSLEVSYDGEPEFKSIEGTQMSYAINTEKSVIRIADKYYCVDQGVWFEASKPKGPWIVSNERPSDVDQLPPECPVYNIKYVYIYESTPEVVYVGYLPGYNYSYVYGGVVVYGTGWYYHPWYGTYYYPRPVTYGYGVHYNPWTGWGFHVSYGYGWMGWGFHPYRRAYWGPRGYHRGYRHGYHRGYRQGYKRGYAAGYRNSNNRNVYSGKRGVNNKASNAAARNQKSQTGNARPSSKPNNMASDRNGNVYQQNKGGNWQQQSNRSNQGGNQQSRPSTSQKPANTQQLNNSQQSRQRGTNNYNSSQQSMNRSGGGSRSGGRRR